MSEELTPGTLYVVATPLGNLGDVSSRALEVLRRADLVLAEDTRRTGLLFAKLGLPGRRFLSLHEHNEEGRVPQVLAALGQGRTAALVSDAGTPLLSDPGYKLVRECRLAGLPVVPVPGPSAPVAALSACGLPPLPHVFLGFLPRKAGEAKALLERFGPTDATMVLFERKDRVRQTLELAAQVLGKREFCVARELTKVHEEFILGRLSALDELPRELRGEVTVVIGPPVQGKAAAKATAEEARELLTRELTLGGKPREVARRAAERLTGWTAKEAYEELTRMRHPEDGQPDGSG